MIVVGGTFTITFLSRTILFLIILVVDFESAIYMFITLFSTEVLVIGFLIIQFYKKMFVNVANTSSKLSKSSSYGSK